MSSSVSILCIGDPHFKCANTSDVDQFIKKCMDCIKKETPDFVVVLGDLLDKHDVYHAEPFNRAIKFLNSIREVCPLFLVVGNHDLSSNQDYLSDKHPFVACKWWNNTYVVDHVMKYEIKNHTFFFVPYVYPGRFEEALNTSNDVWETADCIFCHQEFKGCKMGAIISEEGDEWPDDYPIVISGHIHDAQTVGENIYYPGGAMQHGYAENSDKKIWLVKFKFNRDGELEMDIDEIDLQLPKRKLITLTPREAKKFNPEKYSADTHIKLAIKTTRTEFQSFRKSRTYRTLREKGIAIAFKPEEIDTKHAIHEKVKSVNQKYGTNFTNTLEELVNQEKDDRLTTLFREIISVS